MSDMPPPGGLRRKVLAGLGWSAVRNWGNRFITLAVFVVLARLLGPSELGLFAAAAATFGFLDILIEQGFGDAIVQRRALTPAQLNSAFYVSLVLAGACYLGLYVAAPWLEVLLNAEGLTPILRVGGLALPISAASTCQQAVLRREFDFKWLALRTLIATAVAGIAAIGCALAGLGVWSLVVQYLVYATLSSALLWLRPRWMPGREVDAAGLRSMLGFSGSVFGNRLLDYSNNRFVELFVSATLGPALLGIYLVGARVHLTLMTLLISTVMDVSLSGFSRLAEDMNKLRAAYYQSIEAAAALITPCFVLVGLLAPELVVLAFGARWSSGAFVLQAMSLIGSLQVLQHLNASAVNAIGRPHVSLALNALKAAIVLLALFFSQGSLLQTVVIAYAVGQFVAALIAFGIGSRVLEAPLVTALRRIWPYVVASAAMVLVVQAARLSGWVVQVPALPRVLLLASLAVATYALVCIVLARGRMGAALAMLRRGRGQP